MSNTDGRTDMQTLEDEAAAEPVNAEIDAQRKRAESREEDVPVDDRAAESRTAFGDDAITPHLNDGR